MTYQIAKQIAEKLNAEFSAASMALKEIPGYGTGPMGMTPESVKATPEFRAARDRNGRAHEALRIFNQSFVKTYRKEILADRRAKYRA